MNANIGLNKRVDFRSFNMNRYTTYVLYFTYSAAMDRRWIVVLPEKEKESQRGGEMGEERTSIYIYIYIFQGRGPAKRLELPRLFRVGVHYDSLPLYSSTLPAGYVPSGPRKSPSTPTIPSATLQRPLTLGLASAILNAKPEMTSPCSILYSCRWSIVDRAKCEKCGCNLSVITKSGPLSLSFSLSFSSLFPSPRYFYKINRQVH